MGFKPFFTGLLFRVKASNTEILTGDRSNMKCLTAYFSVKNKIFNALILILLLSTSGCTLNEGDPQVTLCQKLAEQISQTQSLNWSDAEKMPLKDKSMQVDISTNMDNSVAVKARCVYLTDANDAGKDYDVNILDSYQNLPSIMVLDGREIPTRELDIAVQKVTGRSIKDTLKKLN